MTDTTRFEAYWQDVAAGIQETVAAELAYWTDLAASIAETAIAA